MAKPPENEKKSKKQVEADFENPVEHRSEELESPMEQTISPESIPSEEAVGSPNIQAPLSGVSAKGAVSSPEASSFDQLPPRNADIQTQAAPVTGSMTATVSSAKATSKSHATVNGKAEAVIKSSPSKATQSAINDSASDTDAIGFKSYVKALARLITNSETQTPLTIGVYGDWGSGKSSFMEQVRKEISEIAGTKGQIGSAKQVWFNAWKYETQGQLWAALIGEITSSLEKEKIWFVRYWRRFRTGLSKANKLSLLVNSAIFGLLAYFAWTIASDASLINKAAEGLSSWDKIFLGLISGWSPFLITIFLLLVLFRPIWRRLSFPHGLDIIEIASGNHSLESSDRIDDFRKELHEIIKQHLDSNGRLVVYVDDLDRCNPDNVAEVIEAINVVLDTRQCVFLLGMDRERVSLGIEAKYKDLIDVAEKKLKDHEAKQEEIIEMNGGSKDFGLHFLKKVIQVPLNVPIMGATEQGDYANHLLPLAKVAKSPSSKENAPSQEDEEALILEHLEISEDAKESARRVIKYLDPNPRAIKRFVNLFRFLYLLNAIDRDSFNAVKKKAIPLWLILTQRYPDEVRDISRLDSGDLVKWSDLWVGGHEQYPKISTFLSEMDKDDRTYFTELEESVKPYAQLTRCIPHNA